MMTFLVLTSYQAKKFKAKTTFQANKITTFKTNKTSNLNNPKFNIILPHFSQLKTPKTPNK